MSKENEADVFLRFAAQFLRISFEEAYDRFTQSFQPDEGLEQALEAFANLQEQGQAK